MGFSGTDHVKIVPSDAGYVLEDVTHSSDFNPDLPSFSMGAPDACNITSRREMGSGRNTAISTRFSFNLFLFLLALVILSDVIMVAHCKQACGLERCNGRATKGCCTDVELCISKKGCSALCGKRDSVNGIDNGLIRRCHEDWQCDGCSACECN